MNTYFTDNKCWLFPSGLYGTQGNTKAYARRICKKAIKSGEWKTLFEQEEHQSVLDDYFTPIFVSDRTGFFPGKSELWRINNLLISLEELCEPNEHEELIMILIKELFGTLWGCMALLDDHAWGASNWVRYSSHTSSIWPKQVLEAIVNWLPEIIFLSDRIANSSPLELARCLHLMPPFRYQWAGSIFVLSRILGYPIEIPNETNDDPTAEQEFPDWNLIEEMMATGLIIQTGTRFELSGEVGQAVPDDV